MSGYCRLDNCFPDIRCADGEKHKEDCPNWNAKNNKSDRTEERLNEGNANLLAWSGNSMGLADLPILFERTNTIQIGSVGEANSGKTTFLGLLYLLLNDGQFIRNWDYSNSYSLFGWEYIANYLRYQAGDKPEFPPHTSSFDGRDVGLLHLGLKRDNILQDVTFTDVPGEWFSNWSTDANDKGSGNAPWIHERSRGFILFIDCEGLVNEPGKYRLGTRMLIHRLKNDLNNRPVAVLWSKADMYDQIGENQQRIIQRELERLPNRKEFKISIHHGKGSTYHKNILNSINWLLNELSNDTNKVQFEFSTVESDDFFISYRGKL